MSYKQELLDIQSRFDTQFAAAKPGVPIAYENIEFTPPDNAYWVRLYILNGDANQISLGAAKSLHRFVGVIVVQVFGPANEGEAGVRDVADAVANIFRAVDFGSGITCRSPTYTRVGVQGAYFQGNVSAPFYRDELFN